MSSQSVTLSSSVSSTLSALTSAVVSTSSSSSSAGAATSTASSTTHVGTNPSPSTQAMQTVASQTSAAPQPVSSISSQTTLANPVVPVANQPVGNIAGRQAIPFVTTLTEATTYVAKSPLALRNAFLGASTLLDLIMKTTHLGRFRLSNKAIAGFETSAEVFSVIRIVKSIDYFTWGTVKEDWNKGNKVCTILSECAFLVARVFSCIVWAAKQGIVDKWGVVAAQTGALTVFGKTLETCCLSFFILGMSFTIFDRVKILATQYSTLSKNDLAYNITDLASCIAESLMLGFIITGGIPAVALGLLALVAASCGIASSVLDPERPMPKS
jgi:hypothetical protein